jgi:hypothetical protein
VERLPGLGDAAGDENAGRDGHVGLDGQLRRYGIGLIANEPPPTRSQFLAKLADPALAHAELPGRIARTVPDGQKF